MAEGAQLLVVLQRVWSLIAFTVDSVGDLSLIEYACLVDVAESPAGMTRRQLESDFPSQRDVNTLVRGLEERELVERARDRRDRRSFAVHMTSKGHARTELVDEAIAVSLIEASGRLTEETFNRLVGILDIAAPSARERRTVTLLSASALMCLCSYHEAVVGGSALVGLTSAQMAILVMLDEAAAPLAIEDIARRLSLPRSSMMLQLERMTERGTLVVRDAEGRFAILEEGSRKAARFLRRLGSLTDGDAIAGSRPKKGGDTAEDLVGYLIYLFGPWEGSHSLADDLQGTTVVSDGSMSRITGLAALFSMLAALLAYPDRERALERTSAAFAERCVKMLSAAGFEDALPEEVQGRFEQLAQHPADARVTLVRSEYTRLFYTSPRLVSLNGSDWVRMGLTEFARAHGERAAVGLEYRSLGLKNRAHSGEPFDNIVSELDMLSYVAALEACALDEGDAVSAHEWERVRGASVEHHFRELARGVADGIRAESGNAFLVFYASVLDAVLTRI